MGVCSARFRQLLDLTFVAVSLGEMHASAMRGCKAWCETGDRHDNPGSSLGVVEKYSNSWT